MSKLATVKTKYIDAELLIEALGLIGLTNIENHTDKPVLLKTYDGERQYADIVIRKENLPHHSFADMGFSKQADGSYQAHIADFKTSRNYGQKFIDGLTVAYSGAHVNKQLTKAGFKLLNTGKIGQNVSLQFQQR